MKEIWKDIEGYEGLYQISNTGKVKSLKYKGCYGQKLLRQSKTPKGYLIVSLSKNGNVKTTRVHRLVGIMFISNKYCKPHINHIDGNKTNNNLDNLEWVTPKENCKHNFNKLGYRFTKNHIEKLRNKSNKTKIKNTSTGECYSSMRELSRLLNLNISSISLCIKKGYRIKGDRYIKIKQ